jgi:hypothetical protein
MRKDWSAELDAVTFRCTVCRHTWQARPDLVEPDEEAGHHPFRYFGNCPGCEARHQPQAPWERALLKAHQAATGPKTPEGRAATAANLAGHPSPDEALRTRFNAMKHGLSARTATYFPAKPDGYSFCKQCDVSRLWCYEQPACVKQTELFMLTHAAFEQRDPRVLGKVHSDLHAALVASLQMCLQAVLGDGVVIKTPKVVASDGVAITLTYLDSNGERQTVYEYAANPAFKPIADLVSRLGLSLTDLGMTVQAADDDQAALRGRLPAQHGGGGDTLEIFAERTAKALESLGHVISTAKAESAKDPVLLEHQQQTGTGEGA